MRDLEDVKKFQHHPMVFKLYNLKQWLASKEEEELNVKKIIIGPSANLTRIGINSLSDNTQLLETFLTFIEFKTNCQWPQTKRSMAPGYVAMKRSGGNVFGCRRRKPDSNDDKDSEEKRYDYLACVSYYYISHLPK